MRRKELLISFLQNRIASDMKAVEFWDEAIAGERKRPDPAFIIISNFRKRMKLAKDSGRMASFILFRKTSESRFFL